METPGSNQTTSIRTTYSEVERDALFAFGRLCFEQGDLGRGELVMRGLTEVAPDWAPAWLGRAYHAALTSDWSACLNAAQRALQAQPRAVDGLLFLTIATLGLGDFSQAGSYLGELGEIFQSGKGSLHSERIYRSQLVRYQSR